MDPSDFMWVLSWWPHALSEGINPFFTSAIYAPTGCNVLWIASTPLLSVMVWPITAIFGHPVVSYNLLCLVAPAANATAAFMLCRAVVRRFWSACFGGYIFGFSPYFVGHLLAGHTYLIFSPWVPLAAWLAVIRYRQLISPRSFSFSLGLLLIAQFLTSTEIFATMTLVGCLAISMAMLLGGRDAYSRLTSFSKSVGVSYLIALTALSPFLYFVLAYPAVAVPAFRSASLRGFFVPSSDVFLNPHQWTVISEGRFGVREGHALLSEPTLYLGPGLLVVVILFALDARKDWMRAMLVGVFSLTYVLSLGPQHRLGAYVVPLPWLFFLKMPLIWQAEPIRLVMYSYLAASVIGALYLESLSSRWKQASVTLLCLAFLLPDAPYTDVAITRVDTPTFFRTDLYRHFLSKGETVLILPYGADGNSMLWQANTNFYFKMAEGWTGRAPPAFHNETWPAENAFSAESASKIRAFLAAHGVTTVIIAPPAIQAWRNVGEALGGNPLEVGGVLLFRVDNPTRSSTRPRVITPSSSRSRLPTDASGGKPSRECAFGSPADGPEFQHCTNHKLWNLLARPRPTWATNWPRIFGG